MNKKIIDELVISVEIEAIITVVPQSLSIVVLFNIVVWLGEVDFIQ